MEPGQLLGDRYRLDARVDGGGMGDVWRGRDTRLDRTVAIKVLHSGLSEDETFRQRFHGEARAVAALQAPGVVNLFDYGEDPGSNTGVVSYLVMEFVDGRSLRHLLAERSPMPVDQVLDIVAQSADALHAAHQAGIVHRDVKPGNILIKPATGQVKLVDFGIARTRGASSLTETGTIMGSVSYVSPEQLYGRELTGASDVYSLGIVAYECLAGVKPFPGDVPATIIHEQLHKTPAPLPPEVPAEVADVVMRALEKDPADRWPDAAEFAAACRGLQATGPIPAVPSGDPDATAIVSTPDAATTVLNTPDDAKTARVSASARPERRPEKPEPKRPTPPPASTNPDRGGRRARAFMVATAVIALLAMGGIAAARPWEDDGPQQPAAADTSSTAASDADEVDDDTATSESSLESTFSEQPTSETPSEESQTPSETEDSSSSEEDPTGTMPDLYGYDEDGAFAALDAEGFTSVTSYVVGDGEYPCQVVEQDPPAGTETELDSAVSFGVEYTADEDSCKNIGTETGSPDSDGTD